MNKVYKFYVVEYYDITTFEWLPVKKTTSRSSSLKFLEDIKKIFPSVKYRLQCIERIK